VLRGVEWLLLAPQARRLLANLAAVEHNLEQGSIVVAEPARLRVRALPLLP
jgi:hypothetical protein